MGSGIVIAPGTLQALYHRQPRINYSRLPSEASTNAQAALARADPVSHGPSLSMSGATLTIEELMTLTARTENAGHGDEHEWSWSGG
jgi:hypothetical protein